MHQASVGFHCPDCLKSGKQKVYTARSLRTSPIATQVIIGINVVMFVVQIATSRQSNGIGDFSNELDMHTGSVGFLDEYYRLLTSGFLHLGIFHLALNMYALWILGGIVERTFGPVRMVGVYLAAILGGSAGVAILDPQSSSLGASGGVFGLMAMLFLVERAVGRNPFQSNIGMILIINLVLTFGVRGISIGGHLGGLVAGGLAGFVVIELQKRRASTRATAAVIYGLAAVLFLAGVLLSEQYVNSRL